MHLKTTKQAWWIPSAALGNLRHLLIHRFQGHGDIISGIGYLHALDCYVTSSWDGALRLWKRPQQGQAAAGAAGSGGVPSSQAHSASAAVSGDAAYLIPEDSEDAANYVSEYEKAHPLVVPKALSQVRGPPCSAEGVAGMCMVQLVETIFLCSLSRAVLLIEF